ncbi:guanine nucleotide-binding protein G(I)/G(S)/G(O) subunit gamma-7-like isoform X1 [Stegostoma tigrinum]|uniref:guanine nucleotide-binding protein G(I)/G(S)/G(O) subunit gamma-7-like isoform X1 n=1 Tax=Stegostoma tigrinum TaxID=3053191 RepID=UPI0028707596|nr:guanine nucleotide-binding protein G(I)/G(S)/G(O) subunit gamma-7-like isoform X1 [Stegostoma tigrinum]
MGHILTICCLLGGFNQYAHLEQLGLEPRSPGPEISKAAADLMRYCEDHVTNDPLLTGIPTSDNPFKDKKPCIIF